MKLVVRAVIYRLFAGGRRPGLSLLWRGTLFAGLLGLLCWVSYTFAPGTGLAALYGLDQSMSLAVCLVYAGVMAVHILTDGAHVGLLERLRPLYVVPLSAGKQGLLRAIGYGPITLVAAALILPGTYSFVVGQLSWLGLSVHAAAFGLAAACGAAVRVTTCRLGRHAQAYRAVSGGVALVLAVHLATPGPAAWLPAAAVLFVALQATALWCMLRHLPHTDRAYQGQNVRQYHVAGFTTAFMLRAARNPRYRAAHLVIGVLLAGLTWFAARHPAVPFDAVGVVCVLLAGTLAIEARALYTTPPLELVSYGLVGRLQVATWVTAIGGALAWLGVILAIQSVWFLGDLSVSVGFMFIATIGAAAAGILAGSIVSPGRSDILAQLACTALYGAMIWGVLRLLAGHITAPRMWLAGGLCCAALGLAYAVEKVRWFIGIRGKYVFIRRTS